MSTPDVPDIPPPPRSDNWVAADNAGQLIAVKPLAITVEPDTFNKNNGTPFGVIHLDLWVLTGPNAGAFYSNFLNGSALGRQFHGREGSGKVFYGRLGSERVGAGTSYFLIAHRPGDEELIAAHKAGIVAGPADAGNGNPPQGQAVPPRTAPQTDYREAYAKADQEDEERRAFEEFQRQRRAAQEQAPAPAPAGADDDKPPF